MKRQAGLGEQTDRAEADLPRAHYFSLQKTFARFLYTHTQQRLEEEDNCLSQGVLLVRIAHVLGTANRCPLKCSPAPTNERVEEMRARPNASANCIIPRSARENARPPILPRPIRDSRWPRDDLLLIGCNSVVPFHYHRLLSPCAFVSITYLVTVRSCVLTSTLRPVYYPCLTLVALPINHPMISTQ